MHKIKNFQFENPWDAYIGINRWWYNNYETLHRRGGGRYGSECFMPNVFFHCGYGKIPSDLDLGKLLGYSPTKWNTLVTNYLSYQGVHDVHDAVQALEKAGKSNYNVVMLFTNQYKKGKGCLISLQFSKRPRRGKNGEYERVITFSTRATEITKRLIFDLLLIQRVAEFVYKGLDIKWNTQFFSPHVYQCAESFVLLTSYQSLMDWNDNGKIDDKWKKRVHDMYDKYMDAERAETMKMQSHIQISRFLRGDRNVKPMYVKDLKLYLTKKEKDKLSSAQLKQYNNKIAKMKLIPSTIYK